MNAFLLWQIDNLKLQDPPTKIRKWRPDLGKESSGFPDWGDKAKLPMGWRFTHLAGKKATKVNDHIQQKAIDFNCQDEKRKS